MEILIILLLSLAAVGILIFMKKRRKSALETSDSSLISTPRLKLESRGEQGSSQVSDFGITDDLETSGLSSSRPSVIDRQISIKTMAELPTIPIHPMNSSSQIASEHDASEHVANNNNSNHESPLRPAREVRKPRNNAPEFPFLKVSNLIKDGVPSTFKPNTREPIKFECESCSGEMFVMLRTNPLDPEFRWAFEQKRRQFELHIRIKFKQQPRGVVYLGGEIPKRMNLGLATDLACKGLLAVIRRLSSACNAGFGDESGEELPHIVFPLWHAADRLLVTKPGETLPVIGRGMIAEPDASRAARFKDSSLGRNMINKGDTVTFSFHSAYMDLVEWKLKGLGAIRDQSLSWFWNTMPLHVVVYDVDTVLKKHVRGNIRYYLRFELKNTWYERTNEQAGVLFRGDEEEEDELMDEDEDDEDEGEDDEETQGVASGAATSLTPPSSPYRATPHTPRTLQKMKSLRGFRPQRIISSIFSRGSLSSIKKMNTPPQSPTAHTVGESFSSPSPSHQGGKLQPLMFEHNNHGGNHSLATPVIVQGQFRASNLRVPMWVRLRREGGPDVVRFVLLYEKENSAGDQVLFGDFDRLCKIVPSASWRSKPLSSLLATTSKKNQRKPRFTSALARECEQRRVILDEECYRLSQSIVFSEMECGLEDSFKAEFTKLTTTRPFVASKRFIGPDIGTVLFETQILTQVFETQWQEEWMVLLRANDSKSVFCLFFLNRRVPVRIIPLSAILSLKLIDSMADQQLLSISKIFPAMYMETLSKVKCVCFPCEESRSKTFEILNQPIPRNGNNQMTTITGSQQDVLATANGLPEHIPSAFSFAIDTNAVILDETFRWGSKKRIILNSRRSAFSMTSNDDLIKKGDPVEFTVNLLKQAHALLVQKGGEEFHHQQKQINFFNECSKLKRFDLLGWVESIRGEENALKAFFLNLYHIMLIHARLMVGPPSSSGSYHSFAAQMSYEFGSITRGKACVLSLAEIEHRILRPFSSSHASTAEPVPSQTMVTSILALRRTDPRITLALNRLCVSSNFRLTVFSRARVETQLDKVARDFLETFLEIELPRKRVKVPRVLEWYSREFNLLEDVSPRLAVGAVLRWIPVEKLLLMSSLVGDSNSTPASVTDIMAESDPVTSLSGGQIKFEFRKYHWQPRINVELDV